MGVIEYGSGLLADIDGEFNGRVTKATINQYIIAHRDMPMLKGESGTTYMDRVYTILYVNLMAAISRKVGSGRILTEAINTGHLDLSVTAGVGLRTSGNASNEVIQLANEALVNIGQMSLNHKSTQEEMLAKFHKFYEKVKSVEEDIAAIQNFSWKGTRITKSKSGNDWDRRLFANMIEDEEPDSATEEASEMTTLNESIKALQQQVAALTTGGGSNHSQGNNNRSNQVHRPGMSRRNAELINSSEGQAIISNDFKQLATRTDKVCPYCGGDHMVRECARKIWDITHNQLRAHANGEHIRYLESKSWDASRPIPGSFKPYPHGPKCFGPYDPADVSTGTENKSEKKVTFSDGNDRLEKALARIEELEKKSSESANHAEQTTAPKPSASDTIMKALRDVGASNGWSEEEPAAHMQLVQTAGMFNTMETEVCGCGGYHTEFGCDEEPDMPTYKVKKNKKNSK